MIDEEIQQREFTRNVVRLEVSLHSTGHEVISGRSRELSMNGVYIITCESIPKDSPCEVHLTLNDHETTLVMQAKVASIHDGGMGIAFDEMDPESFSHLKKLVLYNAQDHDLVQSELDHHVGFKTRIP